MKRENPLAIPKELFKKSGYALVDNIAGFYESFHQRPVTTGETPAQLQQLLGESSFPQSGKPADKLIDLTTKLLFNHSLLNGHPKFLGYITSSPAPIGSLADMIVAAVNPNVGANILSPMATEIERQTIQWIAEFIGLSKEYSGLMVSGGNMANFTGFLAGRKAKSGNNFKEDGCGNGKKMLFYCSKATHTWIEKAIVLFGHGSKSIRWIETDDKNKINISELEKTISADINNDLMPVMVIGTAGDVSTGATDDLRGIAAVCKKYNLWFHVDGAYGIPAAIIPEYKNLFAGIEDADSIAVDPHKWLYSPLDAGCILVKNSVHLTNTFSSHPAYYNFNGEEEQQTLNYFEYGLENSRSFRALKVWLTLQQIGKNGYVRLINDDINLSKKLFELADKHPELEAVSQNLSITTLRYITLDNSSSEYLNKLNEKLLNALQKGGKVFLSNAIVNGKYCLRACFVNFRTEESDVEEIINIVVEEGRKIMKLI